MGEVETLELGSWGGLWDGWGGEGFCVARHHFSRKCNGGNGSVYRHSCEIFLLFLDNWNLASVDRSKRFWAELVSLSDFEEFFATLRGLG